MGPRQSVDKRKTNVTSGSRAPRTEFTIVAADGSILLNIPKPISSRLMRFLSVRDTAHLALTCKLGNNQLWKSEIDCFDVQFSLSSLLANFSKGYWKLTGMNVKLLDGEVLTLPSDAAAGKLRKLRVKCQLVNLNGLTDCKELQTLIVTWCRGLVDISGISSCVNLGSASLIGCPFTNVSPFSSCSVLHTLDLSNSEELRNLDGLGSCKSLRSLRLHNCGGLGDVSGLSSSTSLTNLNLSGCMNLGDISPLSTITSLQTLNLSNNLVLTDLSRLIILPALVNLDVSSNRELKEVNVLAECPALQVLNISCCFRVTDWSELSRCSTLHTLSTGGLVASEGRGSLSYSSAYSAAV